MRDLVFTFIGLIGGTLIGWSLRDYGASQERKDEEERYRHASKRIDRCMELLRRKK